MMNILRTVVCWVLDHEWSVTAIENHEDDEHAPVRVTETCLRCGRIATVWTRRPRP